MGFKHSTTREKIQDYTETQPAAENNATEHDFHLQWLLKFNYSHDCLARMLVNLTSKAIFAQ